MSRVAVVGAGLGGLAAACRLAAAGHRVEVFERTGRVGGKLGEYRWGGLGWQTGPTLLTLPDVLRETFDACGGWPEALRLRQIRPLHRYRLRDGSWVDDGDLGPAWERVLRRGERIWDASRAPFLEQPAPLRTLAARAVRHPADLRAVAPGRTLASVGRSLDPPLRDVLWRYATYAGDDPRRAPAALASIPAVEAAYGGWAVEGGVHLVAAALHERALDLGVRVHLDAPVTAFAPGGLTVGGRTVPADVIVSDVPSGRTTPRRAPRRSSSAFVLMIAVDRAPPAEHTVLFGADYAAEFDALAAGRHPDDPSLYLHCPPGAGVHPWYVLANAPAGSGEDRTAHVLDALAARGLDVRERLRHSVFRTPLDIARESGGPGGAIYGPPALRRPPNRTRVPGLFRVGGTAHPGGGIPLVLLSARITAGLVGPARPRTAP